MTDPMYYVDHAAHVAVALFLLSGYALQFAVEWKIKQAAHGKLGERFELSELAIEHGCRWIAHIDGASVYLNRIHAIYLCIDPAMSCSVVIRAGLS